MTRLVRPLLALLFLLAWQPFAAASTICISTSPALIQALNDYDFLADGDVLTIKLVQGTYSVGNALGVPTHNAYPNSVGVRILGGYTANCASRTVNPYNTVLDGQNQSGGGLYFQLEYDADALVEGITFKRINAPAGRVLSFELDPGTSDVAKVSVRQCRFVNNSANYIVSLAAAQVFAVDNLIADNTVSGAHAAALHGQLAYQADTGLVVDNNTIANNAGGDGIYFDAYGQQQSARLSDISDNIVYGNGGIDIDLAQFDSANNGLLAGWNLYGTSAGFALDATNLVANPKFVNPAAGAYDLAAGSPAINSGAPIQFYGAPSKDLINNPRIVGSLIDRGALESSFDDRTGFVVTTTADNGSNTTPTPNSLRAAIKAGNAAGGPFKITFALAGGCPHTLNIAGTMLDVTGDVEIDGTSQAGWIGNATYGAFDATLCLFVNGSGPGTPWAFHVPASAAGARLIVRGVMFAGFSDAAIKIENGKNHRIFGNQFGAIGFTVANHDAIRVTGASGGAFIGGFDDTESVNLVAGSADVGVYLDNTAGGSVLGNNVIGFQPDGAGNGGNAIGVYAFNSPSNTLIANYIANSASFGVALVGAGSAGNKLQNNLIGTMRNGGLAPNGSAGVAMQFGARNNIVGATLASDYGGNLIASDDQKGVWITSSGGAGNRVLANQFFSLTGFDIDLDAAGPSANQPANPASGPNNLQNYPLLTAAQRTTGSAVETVFGGLFSSPDTSFRIDVYYSSYACPANGRGQAFMHLGRGAVATDSNGVVNFSFTVPAPSSYPLGSLALVATDPSGNTSEVGNCVAEVAVTPPDAVFADGYE